MATTMVAQFDTYHPLLPFIPKTPTTKLPLTPCCAVCGPAKTPNVNPSFCSRCKAVAYCGRDHQKADYESHNRVCRYVTKCRKKMDAAIADLPHEWFSDLKGRFSFTPATCAVLLAKRDYMLALTATRTHVGVSLALGQGWELLGLCRVDHLGIRNAMPALMLQLGQRQECYDFIKWWATFDPTRTVDLDDLSVPMFTVKNASMAEDIPEGFFHPNTSVFHWAALAYIKIELAFGVTVVMDMVEENGVVNVLTNRLPAGEGLQKRMKGHFTTAVVKTYEANMHFWPSVLDPHSLSRVISPGGFIHGDRFEVQNWLVPHGLLWSQDEFAKDIIQRLVNKL